MFRLAGNRQPDLAIHILRTPPPGPVERRVLPTLSWLGIAPSPHPIASHDLLLRNLELPRRFFPETTWFLPQPDGGPLVPWRRHPRVDLMVPVVLVNEVLMAERWRIATFLTPSSIGLTYSFDSLSRAGLRVLASVMDRETLIRWLARLLVALEANGHGSRLEVELAKEMGLPGPLGPSLVSRVSRDQPLFGPACIRWLLSEVLAAPAPPFGMPRRGNAGKEIEEFLFPSVAAGRAPTRQELLRAVFVLHEDFHPGPIGSGRYTQLDWVLGATTASAFGVHLYGLPEHRVLRARRMWLAPDGHPSIPMTEFRPSDLRDEFQAQTGATIDLVMSLASVSITGLAQRSVTTMESSACFDAS